MKKRVIFDKIDKELEEVQNKMLVETRLTEDRRVISTVFKVFRSDLERMEKTGWIRKPEDERKDD